MDAPQTLPAKPASTKFVLLIIAVAVLAGAALFGSIFLFVFSLMKSNGAYQGAIERAHHNPEVLQALGEPIQEGFFVTGSINTTTTSGHADLNAALSGPKGTGALTIVADMEADVWTYKQLRLNVHGGPAINLAAMHGVVKSYSKEKGFGYLTAGDGGKDLFVEKDDILMFGDALLQPGQEVEYEVLETEKGPKAVRVRVK